MTLTDFIIKWQGKFLDFDGAFGNQCFDLFHEYVVECYGLTDGRIMAAPGAKDIYNNFSNLFGHEYFDKIANTPTGVPLEGDIMIWGNGTWGHVAIFVEGDVNSFRSLDQNYPTGSPCHVQNHTNYDGVLGWIRLKKEVDTGNLQAEFDKCRVDRDSHWNVLIAISDKLHIETSPTIILAEIDKLITYEDLVVQKDRQLQEVQTKSIDLQKQVDDTASQLKAAQDHNAVLTQEVQKDQQTIQSLTYTVSSLQKSVHDLQTQSTASFTGWRKILFGLLLKGR